MILGFVNQQELTITTPTVVADTINYLEAEISFLSDDWAGLDKYYIHFSLDDIVEYRELIDGKMPQSAGLNLTAGKWKVHIRGEKLNGDEPAKRITTNTVPLVVNESGLIEGSPLPNVTQTQAEKLWATIGDMERLETKHKATLVGAINEANQNGGSGGGSGGGADGIGIESVKQTTTSTADNGVNVVTVTLTDGTKSSFQVRNGSKGSQGAQGPQGDKGDKGETGAAGATGATGSAGKDGTTFTPSVSSAGVISWTNNGGLQNPSAVNIKGPKGDPGDTGAQGATGDTGPQGPQGEKGDTGPQGPQGPQGEKGDKGADGTGVTILGSYSSESELNAAHPTGTAGDSYLVNGYLYVWSNNHWENVGNIKGPQGDKGEKGDTGAPGATGAQGEKGEKGDTGKDGVTFTPAVSSSGVLSWSNNGGLTNPSSVSIKGEKGDTGSQGPKGDKGDTGETGAQGAPGADGENGTSVTISNVSESTVDGGNNVVTFSDGSKLNIKNGATGAKGETGSQGPKGDTGAQGPQGEKGEKGDKGDPGTNGTNGYTPVKGTDYWTAADKSEMVNSVLSALPTWTGGSY